MKRYFHHIQSMFIDHIVCYTLNIREVTITELGEKLKQLRLKNNLTQEELAQKLFVSRTAISKWEQGRGYPNIESLKAISYLFKIPVDDLLSGDELIILAENENRKRTGSMRDLIYGILDIMMVLFYFIPMFGKQETDMVILVSLNGLDLPSYMLLMYHCMVGAMILYGIITLAMQNVQFPLWIRYKNYGSVVLNILTLVGFIVSRQPNASIFVFVLLIIKVILLMKRG